MDVFAGPPVGRARIRRPWVTAALLLPLVVVSVNAAAASQTSNAIINASPNPVQCAAAKGQTTITWKAPAESTAEVEVWLSVNAAPEVLFGGHSRSGTHTIDWINAGSSYDFRLYEGTTHTRLLGSTTVECASEPAFIRAAPNPVPTDRAGMNGHTRIEWDKGDGRPGRVFLSINGGQEVLVTSGVRGSIDVPYIRRDGSFQFRLYDERHQQVAVADVVASVPVVRLAIRLIFSGGVLLLIAGSYLRSDPAAFRRSVTPVLAVATTAAALLPILFSEARPLDHQPFPDAHEYADGAHQLVSGKGYVTYVHDNDTWPDDGQARPPRYPPGFSLALLPFAAFGEYPANVLGAATWFAAFYLIACVAAAWSMGGPLAAMLAAGLIGISPFGEQSATVLLADTFGAALTVLLMPLLNKPTSTRSALAGLVAGVAVLVKFSMIVNMAAIALATRGRTRRRILLFTVPALAGLFLYQGLTFGSPLKTGYGYWSPDRKRFNLDYAFGWTDRPAGTPFADLAHGKLMRWACPCPQMGPQFALPNFIFYPSVLAGVFWIFSPPLITLVACFYLWKRWRDPPAMAAAAIVVMTLGLYAGNFYQSERFMASAATLLTVFAAVALASITSRTSEWRQPRDRSARP